MEKLFLLLNLPCSSIFYVVPLASPPYAHTKDGIIVFTGLAYTGTSHAVKLQVVSDNIIRVIATPGMLQQRTFRMNTPAETKTFNFVAKGDKEVLYKGKKLLIKI